MRTAALAAVGAVLAATALTGCALTGDSKKAVDVLERAQAAESSVRSQTFVISMRVTGGKQGGTISLEGGAYEKGPHAGDAYMTMSVDIPGVATSQVPSNFVFVKQGTRAVMQYGGRRIDVPVGQTGQTSSQAAGALESGLTGIDFASIVKGVSVKEGQELNGEPVTKVVGVLDTAALLRESFVQAATSGNTSIAGLDPSVLSNLGDHLSETRVVLFVSEQTGLVKSALVDLSMKNLGPVGDVGLSLTYAQTSVNQDLTFPKL